ncbi:MAG: alpha/beta fold hydrolase [Acidovorax sp.]|nr:alpha/beta fold hydrolase [Acidovorax sp.]
MNAGRQAIHFTTSADGVRLAYAVSGNGPPLVKTPTWITHLEYDWKSPVSRHWLAELDRQHALVRYDARGSGLSDWDVEDISFEKWVSDLETVVDAAGLRRFALTGTSQGAAVAIAFAARHPERVSRLILWGAFCRGMLRRNGGPVLAEKAQMMVKLAEMGWGTEDPAFVQVFTSQFIPGGTTEQWRWFSEKMRISTSPQNAVRFLRAVYDIDVCDLARQVRCPTLVVHSRRDARIPYEEGKLTAALIPGAEFLTLESANHVVLEDEPAWTHLVDELRRFLASPDASALIGTGERQHERFGGLSERERQVCELVAQGLGNEEISRHLFLSPKTVRNHITSIFAKADVSSRAQAIVLAREAGFGHASRPA